MLGLPEKVPADGTPTFTGPVCPDCSGNLVISVERYHVSFTCRVGHTYSVTELLVAKEAALEASMWRAIFAFDELGALLVATPRDALRTSSCGAHATLMLGSTLWRSTSRM
jgi:hypothetical protein